MSTPLVSSAKSVAADTAADEAFEREKAALTSYEEGWDAWDGPVWPLGYVQCRMQADDYVQPVARRADEVVATTPEGE